MILILPLKKIADKLKIYDGVKKIQETEEFLTIKDHKEVLPHTLSFCLLNPSKSDIGKISKSGYYKWKYSQTYQRKPMEKYSGSNNLINEHQEQKKFISCEFRCWKLLSIYFDWFIHRCN